MSAYQTKQTSPFDTVSQDDKHLNMLSISHYIAGALLALFGCCPLIYLVIGVVLVAGVVPVEEKSSAPQYQERPYSSEMYPRPSTTPSQQQQSLNSMPPEYRTPPIGQSQLARSNNAERNSQIAAGTVFIVIAVIMVAVMWAIAIAMIVAGVNLRKRKAYTFCIVMAAIECLFMPLGTILGVFTLLVLTRSNVKAFFEHPVETVVASNPKSEYRPDDTKQWP